MKNKKQQNKENENRGSGFGPQRVPSKMQRNAEFRYNPLSINILYCTLFHPIASIRILLPQFHFSEKQIITIIPE